MKTEITLKPKTIPLTENVDVLVVGGGPAGIGAAISAARSGCKTMLLEKRGFLGGNITACYVENCNHFLNGTGFKAEGLYAQITEQYHKIYNSHDIRPGNSKRFSSEYLKIYLDRLITEAGISVKFHSFVNEVVMDGGKIEAVIIQTKKGAVAIGAKIVIDATGDGDVAFAAGAEFEQGRAGDNLCQPGTVNFRITGVNVKTLTENGDMLNRIGKKFHDDYRAGITGLKCKRQDLPFGRLTPGGQVSYINYSCEYKIDPTDINDLTRGEIKCREYIMEFYEYMKKNMEGFENAEIASIAPEIGFRDSRRIKGEYTLTLKDMESGRKFDDAVVTFPKFYDMLSPDGNMDGNGSLEGMGFKGHIFVPIKNSETFQVPYRSLIPAGIENMLVAGRCISADHVAQSAVRAISLCMRTGEAAGYAAAIALNCAIAVRDVNPKRIQNK
ncbi:MAG: FAD-dependent oxidoreductase [Clostridiales bacterium]|jgi:hypothetical protein|nr:FAD-dependent oxidoreductase [Clostridiales bacterium]